MIELKDIRKNLFKEKSKDIKSTVIPFIKEMEKIASSVQLPKNGNFNHNQILEFSLLSNEMIIDMLKKNNALIEEIYEPSNQIQRWVVSKMNASFIKKMNKFDDDVVEILIEKKPGLLLDLPDYVFSLERKIEVFNKKRFYCLDYFNFENRHFINYLKDNKPEYIVEVLENSLVFNEYENLTDEILIDVLNQEFIEVIPFIKDKSLIEKKIYKRSLKKLSHSKRHLNIFEYFKKIDKNVIYDILATKIHAFQYVYQHLNNDDLIRYIEKDNSLLKYIENPSIEILESILNKNPKLINLIKNKENINLELWKTIIDFDNKLLKFYESSDLDEDIILYSLEKNINNIQYFKFSMLKKLEG